jgi:hypothetical protein
MSINFWAIITNDSEDEPLAILDAYPDGTQSQMGIIHEIIPPRRSVRAMIYAIVLPILGPQANPFRPNSY